MLGDREAPTSSATLVTTAANSYAHPPTSPSRRSIGKNRLDHHGGDRRKTVASAEMVQMAGADSSAHEPPEENGHRDDLVRAVPDGRRRRRAQNRLAVVDALLDLYEDGNLRPGTDEIAERAGLSPRSLFRYFDDVDDLARAAVARQQERALPLFPIGVNASAPLREKATGLVEQRFRLFEAVGQSAKVWRIRSPFQPVLAEELAQTRAFLRSQLLDLFGPELERMSGRKAASVVAAADVLTSFESYQLLLDDQGFASEEAKGVMVESLVAVFGSGPRPRR
jgi:AcrR family transcriptional regulator